MAKKLVSKNTATVIKVLIGVLAAFVLLLVVIPQFNVSAEAIAAENSWYKFHQFFVDLQDNIATNATTYLLYVALIVGAVFMYRTFLKKR